MADFTGRMLGSEPLFGEYDSPEFRDMSEGAIILRGFQFFQTQDLIPPTVVDQTPPPGTRISRQQRVQFKTLDETGLAFVDVIAKFPGSGVWECVWDGDAFSPQYSESTRTNTAGGWQWDISRRNGWSSAPSFKVNPLDTGGNRG